MSLTEKQEIIVRKYVHQSYFDVEKMIGYLESNEIIGSDIFELAKTSDKIQYTFLSSYKPIPKDVFIRRLPIYFYDLNERNSLGSMDSLFTDYAISKSSDSISDRSYLRHYLHNKDGLFIQNTDFEELYSSLEKILYLYSVEYRDMFSYLKREFGSSVKSKYFFHWLKFVELQSENNASEGFFPENLFYSLNKLYEENNASPRFVLADDKTKRVRYDKDRKCCVFTISGYFPIDADGKPVMEWIGLWSENVTNIRVLPNGENYFGPDYFFRETFGESYRTISMDVDKDSRIFVLTTTRNDDSYNNVWIQAYAGATFVEFDFEAITRKREELKLSQKELADLAVINLRSFQRMEKNTALPDSLELIELMTILNIRDISAFVKQVRIADPNYKKFRSGKLPSEFLPGEYSGGGD